MKRSFSFVAAAAVTSLAIGVGIPSAFAAEDPTLTAKAIDELVVVSAKNFPASSDVAFEAVVEGGRGASSVKSSASGRALIAFEAPADFTGTIKISAESGTIEASATVTIGSPSPTPTSAPTTAPTTPTTAPSPAPTTPTSTPSATVPTGTIKVLPIGDSLTDGGSQGAYRKYLFPRLNAITGTKWDFVGSLKDSGGTPDPDHDGHGGWKISQMAAQAEGWTRTYQPDVVLVHGGTNDISARHSTTQIVSDLRLLVNNVYKVNPDAHVIVSKIAPRFDGNPDGYQYGPAMQAYYDQIPVLVKEFRDQGKSIDFVDMTVGFTEADVTADKVHLTESGNEKLSNAFYAALEKWVKG